MTFEDFEQHLQTIAVSVDGDPNPTTRMRASIALVSIATDMVLRRDRAERKED